MIRRPLLALFAIAAALVAPAGASVGTAHADGFWRGDYETGNFDQWGAGTVQAAPGDATIVKNVVRQGRYAARFEVRPGDNLNGRSTGERSEVYATTGESTGTESWWGWSTYFGDHFNPTPNSFWNIFTQWHNTGAGGQANAHFEIDTTVSPWKIELRTFGGEPEQNQRRFYLAEFRRNHWFDFVFHVLWAPDNTGFLEVWVDGQLVLPKTLTPTIYAGQGVYLKQGFYRASSDLTAVLYQDGMRRGDSYAAVAPRVTSAARADTVQPNVLDFVTRPRLIGRRILLVSGRSPRGRHVHVVVRGPHGRVLGSAWMRSGKRGRATQRVRLSRLRRQRVLHVTLVLQARRTGISAPKSAAIRATRTIRLSGRELARATGHS